VFLTGFVRKVVMAMVRKINGLIGDAAEDENVDEEDAVARLESAYVEEVILVQKKVKRNG
jgi:hypothetical protein